MKLTRIAPLVAWVLHAGCTASGPAPDGLHDEGGGGPAGFLLVALEGGEGFGAQRSIYSGAGLPARDTPGVDGFEIHLPEGQALRVRRELIDGGFTVVADLDFDGDFAEEETLPFPVAGTTRHVLRPVGATAVRLALSVGGAVEHRLEPIYRATLEAGGESLDLVAVLLPPEGGLLFADPQREGSFSMYLSPETAFGLGGRTFTASVAYDPPRVVLLASDQPTTQPGDPVPPLGETPLAGAIREAGEGSELVLVFAHPRCRGCAPASPLADLSRAASDPAQRWVWIVSGEDQVVAMRASMGANQAVVADEEAWGTFGASATPTLLRLSAADDGGVRTVLERVSSADPDRLWGALRRD